MITVRIGSDTVWMEQFYLALIMAPLVIMFFNPARAGDGYEWKRTFDSLQSSEAVEQLDRGDLNVNVGWGDLEFGRTDGVRQRLVPTGASMLAPSLGDGSAKLAYYVPTEHGLRLAVSYAPLPRCGAAEPDPLNTRHSMEAAVGKKLEIGSARARFSAGASRANVRSGS